MHLVIPDVMNAAVGIPDALHIVLHILDVLDADEFYQLLQMLQTSTNHPVAGLGLRRCGFFPDGGDRSGVWLGSDQGFSFICGWIPVVSATWVFSTP